MKDFGGPSGEHGQEDAEDLDKFLQEEWNTTSSGEGGNYAEELRNELPRRYGHLLGVPEGDRQVWNRFVQYTGGLHVSASRQASCSPTDHACQRLYTFSRLQGCFLDIASGR